MKYDGTCRCGETLEETEVNQMIGYESNRWEGTFRCPGCKKKFNVYSAWTMNEVKDE